MNLQIHWISRYKIYKDLYSCHKIFSLLQAPSILSTILFYIFQSID